MRKFITNEPHSPIVYLSAPPMEFIKLYSQWKLAGNGTNVDKGWAWCMFCDACEKEGIKPLETADRIMRY